jgi:hypothetical protein
LIKATETNIDAHKHTINGIRQNLTSMNREAKDFDDGLKNPIKALADCTYEINKTGNLRKQMSEPNRRLKTVQNMKTAGEKPKKKLVFNGKVNNTSRNTLFTNSGFSKT